MINMKKTILTLLVAVVAAAAVSAQTALYQQVDAPSSALFGAKVNGVKTPVHAFDNIAWMGFEYKGPAEIEISTTLPHVRRAELTPAWRGTEIRTKDGTKGFKFAIKEPGYYVLRVNEEEKIFIFAEERKIADVAPGAGALDVRSFGVDPSGKTLNTAQLQKAIDQAAKAGKTLVISAGVYKTGTLSIPSNSKIHFAPGAVLKASDNPADFPCDPGFKDVSLKADPKNYTVNGEYMTFSRMILVDKAENVEIKGYGTIDGNGLVLRPLDKPANLVRIRNSKNVTVEGLVLRNPAAWNVHVLNSDNVTFRNVKILNNRYVSNGDGIDPDASRNVLVENTFMYCSDDNIAVKSTNNGGILADVDGIVVRGNVFLTRKSSMKVGTETKAARMANITFENNDIIESDRAMSIYCNDGASIENLSFINNRIDRSFRDNKWQAIDFQIGNRYGKGRVKGLLIKDCSFSETFPYRSSIKGLDAGHRFSDVVIDNMTIQGRKVMSLEEARIDVNQFVDTITFK